MMSVKEQDLNGAVALCDRLFSEQEPLLAENHSACKRTGLGCLPISTKLFISLMFCVAGLGYAALLGSIWFDTEMQIARIVEGYGTMGGMELVQHSFQYLFWFFGIFSVAVSILLASAFPETLKRIFAVAIPLLIISDVGCAWLIRYSSGFAWLLAICGFLLAGSFLALFLLIQFELWFRKSERET